MHRGSGALTGDSQVTFTGRVDDVFRALAEPARRRLLDRLVEQDGLTLRERCAVIPELTKVFTSSHSRRNGAISTGSTISRMSSLLV